MSTDGLENFITTRREFTNSLITPMAVIARDGTIRWANIQAVANFGGKSEDLIGKNITDILTKPSGKNTIIIRQLKQALQAEKLLAEGKPSQTIQFPEIDIVTHDGRRRKLQFRSKFIKDDEEVIGSEIEIIDITEQAQLAALNEAAKLLNQDLYINKVLTQIETFIHQVLPHDRANIILQEGYQWRIYNKWKYTPDGKPTPLQSSESIRIEDKKLFQEMINDHRPRFVSNTGDPDSGYKKLESANTNGSWVGAPIVIEGKVVGFINLNSNSINTFTQEDANLLMSFTTNVATAINNARIHEKLSMHDQKTGLYNEAYMNIMLDQHIAEALRYDGRTFSIIYSDLNRFSAFNDIVDYPFGDMVLKRFSQIFDQIRNVDIKARWQGEEFITLISGTPEAQVVDVAKKLRDATVALPPVIITKEGELGITTKHPHVKWEKGDEVSIDAVFSVVTMDEIKERFKTQLMALSNEAEKIQFCKRAFLQLASDRIHKGKEETRKSEQVTKGKKGKSIVITHLGEKL